MTVELELSVLQDASGDLGYVAGIAITDELIVAAGGTSSRAPIVMASSNARHFETRKTPRELGLRDVLAAGDALWTCGEYGQLAISRDHGATWKLVDTATDACLFALALADDAVWVVGDHGYAARVVGERLERVEFKTTTRFTAVYALSDEVIALGYDGALYRWRNGEVTRIATGAQHQLTALAISKLGTWLVVGDAGFIGRSPDGAWFSRVKSEVEVDLEDAAVCPEGTLVAVGDRGIILVSSDDGRQWTPMATQLTTHLWSIERFGTGVLIGGDDGLIAKLAAPGDQTWQDRINVFGGAKTLDVVFANGPDGFVVSSLVAYLDAIAEVGKADSDVGKSDEVGDSKRDRDALTARSEPGSPQDFATNYGVPLPPEMAAFVTVVDGRDESTSFEELRLDNDLLPNVGQGNVFELLVRRDQQAHLGTGLVEALCGVFCIGSQRNGDTYHMELYEWDGPRQVLHYDHETHAFTGVFADSLDSIVYLAALKRARASTKISQEAFDIGLRKLHGRVAPTWHFSIDTHFVALDPKRRDTEFFFYRSRWICALLKNDGVTEIADIPPLFNADFNQVMPQDQLPARYEACEKLIPTALYSMWRAYFFDEPELVPYLEIGRRHPARLVRDAAALIDELRAGRNELGTIKDMRAHLAAFRALDLDPRRADARQAEVEARGKLEARRTDDVLAELARTPQTGWADLAWRWLDDGVAHRAILGQLHATPELAAQLTALGELDELPDVDREVALPQLASALSPELEAVLVGSLVRDDHLAGVLPAREDSGGDNGHNGHDHHDSDSDDDESPGWEAIDGALEPLYGDAAPHAHYGTVLPYMVGGNDPLHGISVYLRNDPIPHFHFVTYGFTDLFVKQTEDPDESGFGFELTLRLGRAADDTDVPNWVLNFLQNLARYVFGTGNRFAAGHKMGLNGPIALDRDTKLTAILFAEDPELGAFESPFGKARFIQIVGITDDEYRLIQEWSTTGLVDILRKKLPFLVTEPTRDSVLEDPILAAEVRRRVDAEGSSEDLTFAGEMAITVDRGRVRIEMGALYAAALPRSMRGRLRHDRPYTLRGRTKVLRLVPSSADVGHRIDQDGLELSLSAVVIDEIAERMRDGLAGTYRFETWPALEIVVTPSLIRDQTGRAIEVRGIADANEAQRLIDEENAQLDDDDYDDDGDDDGDDGDDDDDDDDDGDDNPPPAHRVRAALAMSERALRLAPDDSEVQFTHAMLLIDGDHAGLAGKLDELIAALATLDVTNRINIAVRLGKQGHPRLADVLDVVLDGPLPERIIGASDSDFMASYRDVAEELLSELGAAALEHAPAKLAKLIPLLPLQVNLVTSLAWKAIEAGHREHALALYERLLTIPIPKDGDERTNYLRGLNNACVQAHAAKAHDLAVRIADRAQPVAHDNPYIYHSAACAYAAVGDYAKAFEQVKLAVEHNYDHLGKVEVDSDLGPILEWPEFKELFREWRDRQEGN